MNEVLSQILFFGMGLLAGWGTMLWLCVENAEIDREYDEELEDELREEALNYAKKEKR